MKCPSCNEQIDDDSWYCDRCGIQIMVCSDCGLPGTRKFCNHDGKPMVTAESRAAASPPGAAPVQPPAQQIYAQQDNKPPPPCDGKRMDPPQVQVQTPPQTVEHTQKPGQASGGNTVKFTGNGITFEAKDGDVIGRKTGSFVGIFAGYQYVSGTHCKIVKLPAGWHIQDLGSSNGTFVQGNKLAPNAPYPLTNNAAVKIATTDFTVTF